MRKIPTVFKRDPDDMKRVLPEVTPGCEWVLAGEGQATRKFDGTCVMLDSQGEWWARREVKPGKPTPAVFLLEDADPVTGKTVGWVPMPTSPFRQWHADALNTMAGGDRAALGDLAAGTYELCGPKINGNPEGYTVHVLIRHSTAERLLEVPTDYVGLREWLSGSDFEGIVWHHPDGRMAKLKARDFPKEAAS